MPDKVYEQADWQSMWDTAMRIPDKLERFQRIQPIEPGQVVADIGCGSGAWAIFAAELVGSEGRVYATDIEPSALAFLRARLEEAPGLDPHGCIQPVLGTPTDVGLPAGSIDHAMLLHVHFHNAEVLDGAGRSMIASIYRALRPGGRVVVEDVLYEEARRLSDPVLRHYLAAGFQ